MEEVSAAQGSTLACEAFKLANYYMFGKPVTIVTGAEEPQPIKIDISAIPKFRAPVAKLR